MSDKIEAPGLLLRLLESRAGLEAGQLMLQMPLLRLQAQRGHGEPVLVLPGFMADDSSTQVLRYFLGQIGYKPYAWELGVNRVKLLDLLPPLREKLVALVKQHDQPVTLVGWSRGGILSRELARDDPELVRQVITIGSPVKGGPNVSSIGRMVKQTTGLSGGAMAALLRERQKMPIKVPIRAIYSRLDGIVSWQACIDDMNEDVQHFEIWGSHVGMGANVDVFRLLPELLADSPVIESPGAEPTKEQ